MLMIFVYRCRQWVKVVGDEDLVLLPPSQLYSLRRVCEDHFPPEVVSRGAKFTRLKEGAVPSLLLPLPLSEELMLQFMNEEGRYQFKHFLNL